MASKNQLRVIADDVHTAASEAPPAPQNTKRQPHATIEPQLSKQEVLAITHWSNSTLYNRMKAGEFPKPICTGSRTRCWNPDAVRAYLAACHAL